MSDLDVTGIVKTFGGVTAVDGVDLTVDRGEIVGLIGPNGAGKTTLFHCVSGYLTPDAGTVTLDDVPLIGLPPERRARAGIGRTFQRLEVFHTMTVREHLRVAAEQAGTSGRDPWWLRLLEGYRRQDPPVVERAAARFALEPYLDATADALPTGVLRRVEAARALATGATILLLDEPASGLDAGEVEDLARMLAALAEDGIGMLLVEHDVGFVLGLVDRLLVMDRGRLIASGPPDEVVDDPRVQAAYLGREEVA